MSGKVPPSSRAKSRAPMRAPQHVTKSARIFERFTGHEADTVQRIKIPDWPKSVAIVGDLDAVEYTTVRDGITERYRHKFHVNDKPLLCVAPNGKLFIIGGRYRFTERGIVDKSDKKE